LHSWLTAEHDLYSAQGLAKRAKTGTVAAAAATEMTSANNKAGSHSKEEEEEGAVIDVAMLKSYGGT
jgi:hypothetical protein